MARPTGPYPQQHIRIAAEPQELQGILLAIPDTRARAKWLMLRSLVIETIIAVEQAAINGQYEQVALLAADLRTLLIK